MYFTTIVKSKTTGEERRFNNTVNFSLRNDYGCKELVITAGGHGYAFNLDYNDFEIKYQALENR